MKKVVEKKVEENQIVKEIIKLAEETRAWIFLSDGLVTKLKDNYKEIAPHIYVVKNRLVTKPKVTKPKDNYKFWDYASERRLVFILDETVGKKLSIDLGHIWNEVSIIPKEDVYIASDPDVIYFLS